MSDSHLSRLFEFSYQASTSWKGFKPARDLNQHKIEAVARTTLKEHQINCDAVIVRDSAA